MSWQDYVDFILDKGNVEDCMIVDSTDGFIWAATPNFQLQNYKTMIIKEDGSEVEEDVSESSNLIKFMIGGTRGGQGIRLNRGKKLQILRDFKDDETGNRIVYGKVSKGGCCIAVCGPCILIGTFNENKGHTSSGCNNVITLMARHLLRAPWKKNDKPSENNSSGNGQGNNKTGTSDWQSYIDIILVGKGNVSEALICSASDGKIWASTQGFELKKYEGAILDEEGNENMETIDETKNLLSFMAGGRPKQGLRLNESKKYQIVKAGQDDDMGAYVVNGKKVKGGVWIAKAKKAIVVCVYDEQKDHNATDCAIVLANCVKHLMEVDF